MTTEGSPSPAPTESPDKQPNSFHPDLAWREELTGHRLGDRVVRISRHRYFWGSANGTLLPRPAATAPRSGFEWIWHQIKHILLGTPIPTSRESQERLSKAKALAVLSSDALSSVAYATEAAMRVLLLAGVAALSFALPISVVIALVLLIVATSYQQTIRAYPSGGGSYIVAHENLGRIPGLFAGAALLIGYVLTVAVSVAAGVAALISAFPALQRWDIALAVGAVTLVTVMNLRGVRESGSVFMVPTYVFVLTIFGMIGFGLYRLAAGGVSYQPVAPGPLAGTQPLTWFLVLSAFAKGCSAMTGTEAIANAVPAFQAPESKNARLTLGMMAALLAVMFVGISFLVVQIGIVPDPNENKTVLSDLTRVVMGESWYYYLVQFATALILLLAANTSYTGFPWLLSVMARDNYVPRWFGMRGDRLVFSTGIAALAVASIILLVVFGSSVDKLLPLYAIGVFTAFTLSQSGMVVHWIRGHEPNRMRSTAINGVGAVTTGVATIVIGMTKFGEGAWMVIVVAPILVALFLAVNGHYRAVGKQLQLRANVRPTGTRPMILVPVGNINLVTQRALAFAQDLGNRVVAVHVSADPTKAEALRVEWQRVIGDVPLVIIESPYRLLLPPLLAYVDALRESHPGDGLVVMLPEFVPRHWWENTLHNQTALRLKASLLYRPGVVVASFPFHLSE